jgi:anti-anti-sigma regulatory factor
MGRPEVHSTQIDASVWLVVLSGEHDLSTVPDLRYWLREPLGSEASVIVDMADAGFVDSGTLAELILSRRQIELTPGRRLVLVAPPGGAAAELLDLVDRERRLFPTFETRAAAIASFGVVRLSDEEGLPATGEG